MGINVLDCMYDDVGPCFYGEISDVFFDFSLQVGAVGDFYGLDDYEDIIVGPVFVGNAVFDVSIFDRLTPCVGTEQDEHLRLDTFTDFIDYQL